MTLVSVSALIFVIFRYWYYILIRYWNLIIDNGMRWKADSPTFYIIPSGSYTLLTYSFYLLLIPSDPAAQQGNGREGLADRSKLLVLRVWLILQGRHSAKTAAEMRHELKAFPAKSASSFSDSVTSEAISSTYRPWNLNISEPKLALPTQIMGPSLWLLKLAIVVELAHTTD